MSDITDISVFKDDIGKNLYRKKNILYIMH